MNEMSRPPVSSRDRGRGLSFRLPAPWPDEISNLFAWDEVLRTRLASIDEGFSRR